MHRRPDQPGIEIRAAAPDDAAQIAAVLSDSFVEYKASYTPEGYAATTPDSERIRSRLNEGPAWVAVHDGTIVGTVSVVPRGAALYIRGMAVLPTTRGQRIGELLLKQIESYANTHGYQQLFLSTTPFLARAIRLYEHTGFRRSPEGPHELFGTPLFTMVKTLETSG